MMYNSPSHNHGNIFPHDTFQQICICCKQGWRLLSRFHPLRYFPTCLTSLNYMLSIVYPVDILQVSPQLTCGDNCQSRMWLKNVTGTFVKSKILLTEKLTNGALLTQPQKLMTSNCMECVPRCRQKNCQLTLTYYSIDIDIFGGQIWWHFYDSVRDKDSNSK